MVLTSLLMMETFVHARDEKTPRSIDRSAVRERAYRRW